MANVISLAIVGRPNVGKSTLFNRLVGKRVALVDNQPGVTRDYREALASSRGRFQFKVVDTAGLDELLSGELESRIREMALEAIGASDACIFLIDARAGILAGDLQIANQLRKSSKPVILVANKSEGRAADAGYFQAFELGIGEPIRISAEHGLGIDDLTDAIRSVSEVWKVENHAPPAGSDARCRTENIETPTNPDETLAISVIGRPNSGKSTLVNRIIGEERLLTGEVPGITRDFDFRGRQLERHRNAPVRHGRNAKTGTGKRKG